MSTSSLASCTSDGTTGSCSASAFSNLTTSAINKEMSYDKCPRCKVQFDFLKRVNVTKVPLILTCKHTVCEDCIRRLILTNTLVCPVCKAKFEALRTQVDSLTDLFPPHYALIGHLVWAKNSPNRRNVGFVSTGYTLGNRNSGGSDLQEFNFDTETKDEGSDEDYEKTTLSFVFEKCIEHSDQYVNIHCEECIETYCCYCFIENHAGHKATYLYKLTDTELTNLQKLKADIEVILAQLLVSKKQAKELKTADLTNIDLDIKNYFSELHAKLHVAERNIRKRLLNIEAEVVDLDAVNFTLKSGLHRVNQILRHFNLLNTKQLNVRALYEEAKDIRDIPCRLVSDQEGLRPIEFLSDNVFDDVEDSICLKTLPQLEYSLLPIEDWSQAQEKFELDIMRRQPESCINSEPRTEIIKTLKRAENEKKKSVVEAGKIRVLVTHINSMDSFFIQKYTALDCLKEMNANIGRKGRKRANADEFKINGVYGVLYETKNSSHWRRGKLMEVIRNGENKPLYKMYFFDYGNSKLVTKEKLKLLDIRSITRPPFSYECKLINPDKTEFEPNAHLHLPQIIGEKELYVRFMDKQANRNVVQEVDLLLTTSNGGFISVRDLLRKSPATPVIPVEKDFVLTSQLRFFKNSKRFSNGNEERVVVTYVRDPFYVCVQLAQNLKLIERMKNDMEQHYKNSPVMSCIPVADTDVIVKYEDEKQGMWHRAKITSVDMDNKEADVYFVDWGYSTEVSWSNLRSLTENFIKAECQGIIVKLAAIEKLDMSRPWSEETVNFLRESIGRDECRMLVSDADNLEVVLFQCRPAADICLNALLTEKKFAISTGPLSQTVLWPNFQDSGAEEEDDDFSFQMVKKSGEIIVAEEEDAHLKTGIKLQVSVINFESPDLIYIKFNKYKEIEDELHKELQIHYSSESKSKKFWKPGDQCVVLDSVRRNYFRAVVKSSSGKDNYIVYLYDHVRELNVSRKFIFLQDKYFQDKYLCYVFKCRLSNIRPAGDAGKWSSLAIEMLQKIFSTYKNTYVKKLEINEHDKMVGVIMWYCLTTPAKALEPSKVKYISINQTLIESGVALVSSPIVKPPDRKVVEEAKSNAKSKDWYAMICEDEEKCQTKENGNEVDSEGDELLETGQNSWLEPFKIEFTEFDAVLTCVDNEGHFSVRSMEMDQYYQDLEENLTAKLNSMPATTDNVEWQANDMCTVLYEDKWYRGTVLDVLNDREISVEMIDFNSEHIVTKDKLTKLIMFLDIPPLVNKVKLYDVYSNNGRWSADDVSTIISLSPDNIRVAIKKDLNCEVPYAELYLESGLSLNDLIVQKIPHMKRYENKACLGNFEDTETDCGSVEDEENVDTGDNGSVEDMEKLDTSTELEKCYNYVCLSPPFNKKQKLTVVSILRFDNSYNVVLGTKESTNLQELEDSDTEMQIEASRQPALQKIELNEPCICKHLQKNVWSRAVVYKLDSLKFRYVSAFFVDYGTLELVPVEDLKEIRKEWLDLPVNMQIASISIELVDNSQAEFVLMQLNSLRGKTVSVEVVSEEPLNVHLYDGKKLFYQDFIDCGIIKAI